jgi:flagellar basal-body rod modification protein FlgD
MSAVTQFTQGTAITGGTSTPKTQGSDKLGKDEFLRLLMAQMGSQDPTSPTDSSQFVAQLAQFSQLELQQNTNDTLQNLLIGQAATQQSQVINLVGKDVTFNTDQITIDQPGKASTSSANLKADAAKASASIIDANGKTIRTIDLGAQNAGTVSIPWNGMDDQGNSAPAGSYTVTVNASDSAGKAVDATTSTSGQVTGISFQDGTPSLIVAGAHIKLSDVTEINERNTP